MTHYKYIGGDPELRHARALGTTVRAGNKSPVFRVLLKPSPPGRARRWFTSPRNDWQLDYDAYNTEELIDMFLQSCSVLNDEAYDGNGMRCARYYFDRHLLDAIKERQATTFPTPP